jgi:rubrerythrin
MQRVPLRSERRTLAGRRLIIRKPSARGRQPECGALSSDAASLNETHAIPADRIRAFHQQLQRCYEATSERQRDERLALLLEHMAQHEKKLEACLGKFGRESACEILGSWIQYVPDKNVARTIADTEFHPHMTVEDVIRSVLALDRALIEFYRGIATSLVARRVRELFSDLVEMEESKSKQYSTTVAQLLE